MNFQTSYYDDEQCEKFYSRFRECAQAFGCFYMGYISEDLSSETRRGFTTNPDWQREYIGNHLIDDCHLWKEVSKFFSSTRQTSLILPWSMIKPTTSKQKDIILYREDIGIGQDGISFCSRTDRSQEYLYFAPEKNGKNFLKYVSSNIMMIRDICKEFRNFSINPLNSSSVTTLNEASNE